MKTKRLLFSALLILSVAVQTRGQSVTFRFSADSRMPSSSFRSTIEVRLTRLLTEINRAQRDNRSLRLSGLSVDPAAEERLNMIWRDLHFFCVDHMVVSRLLEDAQGYQVRDISINIVPVGTGFVGSTSRDLVITFSKTGQIRSITPATEMTSYTDIMKNGRNVTDTRRRREIVNFVEQYFSYYEAKDINAIEKVFSDNALIITGSVVRTQPIGDMVRAEAQVRYKRQNKSQYICNLRRSFNLNRYIKIDLEDIKVERNGADTCFYGVTVRQKYHSSTYSDDGYVFLLWDFHDELEPKIHVRTWQPYEFTQPKDVFTDKDFMF